MQYDDKGLSTQSPMNPMEGSRPVARARSVKAQELNGLDPVV
ncbi:hypothetical protein [Streptomyces sp. MUSC 14]|nr:hypothetical protein [Streptomyces sp. MUSC 14]